MWLLVLSAGFIFGVAFGLTGVGSVLAVPLLTYGFGLSPHRAVCMAMVSVNALAATSIALRWRASEFAPREGIVMATGGILAAPLGAAVGRMLSSHWLMVAFGFFVAAIGARLLFHRDNGLHSGVQNLAPPQFPVLLALAGGIAGFLAGMLGIGGVIVTPALVLLGGVEIHRAIATSLPITFAISVSAIASHLLAGQSIPFTLAALFTAAGCAGAVVGIRLGRKLSGPRLQLVFALAILTIATYVLLRQLIA